MAWFRKEKKPRQPRRERLEIPADVWEKCEACGHTDIREKFVRNFNVCPNCDFHRRIRANDSFSGLVAFGLLASWFVHVVENMGMTLNLAPITGIPLPFFSYGGSFMLASWIAIGILLRISAEGRGGRSGPFAV